jgi:hypothetical protein
MERRAGINRPTRREEGEEEYIGLTMTHIRIETL